MSILKQYFKIMRTFIRRYTSPKYLHSLYYQHKFNKLVRFYMRRCNYVDDAVSEARKAFSWLYLFDYTQEELDANFKRLV